MSVLRTGEIRVFAPFVRTNELLKCRAADLYYDEAQEIIGISFLERFESLRRHQVYRLVKEGSARRIQARVFFKKIGISVRDVAGRYQLKESKEQGIPNFFVAVLVNTDESLLRN